MYVLVEKTGHYYVQGVGYATIVDVLTGVLSDPKFLLLLIALKLLATCLTLGSGGSGGIFSPALYIGAASGGVFGMLINNIFPSLDINPVILGIAGMAGMISGTTGAVMTAIVMVVEMTNDMNASLPVLITVASSYFIRKTMSNDSVYTLKLSRRNEVAPEGLQASIAMATHASNMMTNNFCIFDENRLNDMNIKTLTVVEDSGNHTGIINPRYIKSNLTDSINRQIIKLNANELLTDVVCKINTASADYALIYNDETLVGIIGKDEILKCVAATAELLE
ncbi:MAG: hypothetical protein HOI53_03170 [Francisellaceae bacterium]|nr:hypothetical protein [Francisellaceae bacterium]